MNACDTWFASLALRDTWIFCLILWKSQFFPRFSKRLHRPDIREDKRHDRYRNVALCYSLTHIVKYSGYLERSTLDLWDLRISWGACLSFCGSIYWKGRRNPIPRQIQLPWKFLRVSNTQAIHKKKFIVSSLRDAWILLKSVRETGSPPPPPLLCYPLCTRWFTSMFLKIPAIL